MVSFSNRLRQIILITVLIALGFLLVKELYIFLPGFLGAITLYILSRKQYIYLTLQKNWNKSLTATLFLLGFLVAIGFPVYYMITLLSPKITEIFSHSDEVLTGLKSVSAQIKEWTGQELFSDSNVAELQKRTATFFPAFLNSTVVLKAVITGVFESVHCVEFKYTFESQGILICKGDIKIGII